MPQKLLTRSFVNQALLVICFIAINVVNKHVLGDPFRDGKLIVFLGIILMAATVWICGRFNFWLGAVVGIAAAEWVFASGTVFGIVPVVGSIGFLYLGHLVSYDESGLLLILRASTIVQLVFCLFQAFGYQCFGASDPYFKYMMLGNMGHPVVLSAWLAAVAPLAYFYWSRLEFMVVCAVCLYAGSTMGILALLAGGLYVWWRRIGWPILAISLVMAILLLLGVKLFSNVEFFSLSGRMLPWSRAVFWLKESPWFGYGPGSWSGMYPRWGVQYAKEWSPMHSDALQLAFEVGIPAFLLFALGMWRILRSCSIPFGAVMAALLVNGLGSFPFHIPQLAFLFCAALAVGHNGKDGLPGKASDS